MGLFDSILRQTENLIKNSANQAVKGTPGGANPAPASGGISKTVTLSALPQNAAEMRAMPEFTLSDPFTVLAFGVAALNRYATDREASKEMLNALKGPEPLTVRELQFINDRFMDGKDYITRSYFGGTSPENDYTPSVPYTVKITEQSNSRENEGYIKLYLTSSGADSIRPVTLRNKPSTGEWFLWEFDGMLSSIRIPKSTDKWA
ncbi:MAG: hypothetical protein IKZ59_01815 [Clostridia bacterium]|nr:hypothetical protein [Clostridia bacterium]